MPGRAKTSLAITSWLDSTSSFLICMYLYKQRDGSQWGGIIWKIPPMLTL